MFFSGILSIQCKIDQVTLGDQPVNAIDLFATPGLFQCLSYISFG